jgi:K+-transporting ATPase KdpF subunit
MAFSWGRLLRRLLWPRVFLRQPESGGLTVAWTTILALVVAVVLVIYLAAALVVPERFS